MPVMTLRERARALKRESLVLYCFNSRHATRAPATGFFARAGTPKAAVERLSGALRQVVESPP